LNTKKANPAISKYFISKILEISGGYLTSEQLDKFFKLIENEKDKHFFTEVSESNLLRIFEGMYNKRAFLSECLKYPHYIEIIAAISANSNYLADILVRDPENFYWIVNPSVLKTKLELDSFTKSLSDSLKSYNSLQAKLNAIRAIKRKEILRIGLKDILGIENLNSITEELSTLAKSITSILFDLCYKDVLIKYQLPKLNRKYCMIALGKLGGNELNYSSDIDLMVFYDKNTKINNQKNYHEFLTEVILLFINSATSITNEGYIYRVDFRLRPDGKNSPLCNTYESYINYYESRGEDWERQMLIKADFICGDERLYMSFSNYLSHFIYPQSFSVSPLNQVKKLKREIEKKLEDEENIKLVSGGIRNIEFSVQALQLLNGGRFSELKTPNTLDAISRLKDKNLISLKEAEIFTDAYIFYRKIEHYLQLMNDTQTHTIPTEGIMLNSLTAYLGFKNVIEFKKKISSSRNNVLKIYDSITGNENEKFQKKHKSTLFFKNKSKAERDLDYIRSGKGLLNQKQFDNASIEAFLNIEDSLVDYLAGSKYPDSVLQNFVRIIRNVPFPSLWYTEFTDNKFFKSFLNVCEFNPRAVSLFAEDNSLREYFITRKIFEKLKADKLSDLDTKNFLFHLLCDFTLKIINAEQVPSLLKDFFMIKIKKLAESTLDIKMDNYFIAALGSFGSGEMSFSSDIDLIFVIDSPDKFNKNEKEFQALLLNLKKELSPFNVDCRLRPEGKSSQLVWKLDSYKDYLLKRARTWEFQSLCKLNFVTGSRNLFNNYLKALLKRINNLDSKKLREDILEMRKMLYPADFSGLSDIFNIKKSRGGIIDLEFVLQYQILSDSKLLSRLRGKKNKQVLETLSKTNKKFQVIKDEVISGYNFLKELELANQSVFNVNGSQIILNPDKLNILLSFMQISSYSALKMRLSKITKQNNKLFTNLIKSTNA
jgi:[glutamine synthetase] adenylyltransferase / [glutamine synthetase]-adenylyl-L-tyrosine phosphorylase